MAAAGTATAGGANTQEERLHSRPEQRQVTRTTTGCISSQSSSLSQNPYPFASVLVVATTQGTRKEEGRQNNNNNKNNKNNISTTTTLTAHHSIAQQQQQQEQQQQKGLTPNSYAGVVSINNDTIRQETTTPTTTTIRTTTETTTSSPMMASSSSSSSSSNKKQQPSRNSLRRPVVPPAEWDVLLSASQKNRVDQIRVLILNQGIPPSHSNSVGQSALHIAALWGHVEACQVLLELGANVHAMNKLSQATPLHMVVQPPYKAPITRQVHVIQLLLQYGADKMAIDQFGYIPLDYAMEQREQKLIRQGYERNQPPERRQQRKGQNVENYDVLMDDGDDDDPFTPLIRILSTEMPPLWILIQNGNLLELQQELFGMDNETAQWACNQSFRNQTAYTIAVNALLEACEENDNDNEANDKDNKESSSNNNNNKNVTIQERLQIVQELIAKGGQPPSSISSSSSSNLDVNDDVPDPPLFRTLELLREAYKNHPNYQLQQHEVVVQPNESSLSKNNKDNDNKNNNDQNNKPNTMITVLEQMAIMFNKQQQEQDTTTKTADHDNNTTTNTTNTTTTERMARWLHMIARRNELHMLQFVCEQLQWNVNLMNRQGMTALQFTARSGKIQSLQYLLQQPNINIYHVDNHGQTALDAAIVNEHVEIQQLLIQATTTTKTTTALVKQQEQESQEQEQQKESQEEEEEGKRITTTTTTK